MKETSEMQEIESIWHKFFFFFKLIKQTEPWNDESKKKRCNI